PTRPRMQAIRLAVIENAVVSLVPVLEATAHISLGRPRFEAHERVGKIVASVVELRRKVIRLRLALLTDEGCLARILMHVVRDRAHVVEELRIDRPALVLLPDVGPDERVLLGSNRLAQRERLLAVVDDVAQALVPVGALVSGRGGG